MPAVPVRIAVASHAGHRRCTDQPAGVARPEVAAVLNDAHPQRKPSMSGTRVADRGAGPAGLHPPARASQPMWPGA
jgi:hypothetical protein